MTRPEVGRRVAGGSVFRKPLNSNERPEGRKGRRGNARVRVCVLCGVVDSNYLVLLYPHARNTLRPFRPSGLFLFISMLMDACPPAYPPACIRPSIFSCSTTNNSKMVRGVL